MSPASSWWRARLPAVAQTDPQALPPSERCLFVIGAARSGTTVLQNALNDSPDIFLFGEADFHADAGTPGFAARYNAMHRAWANQETKSSFCPAVLPTDGTWRQYLTKLGSYYRFVGAKIVINPVHDRDFLSRLFDFHCRNFYLSRYIFTFRAPLPTVTSTRELQLLVRGKSDEIRQILHSYGETARLYIRMLRNLPHVRAVFQEEADRPKFDELAQWLDIPLPHSHGYFDPGKVRKYPDLDRGSPLYEAMAALDRVYGLMRQAYGTENWRLQAEQNNNHLREDHFTEIGRADRQLGEIIRGLARATAP